MRMLVSKRIIVSINKFRNYSSNLSLIQLTIDEKSNIARAAFQKPPVNSLNTAMLTEIQNVVATVEKSKCNGLILTSNVPGIFTAGLDLLEFCNPKKTNLENFWKMLQDTFLKLYLTPVPVVALINGHSPAGGCMIAMCSDYRVMLSPQFTIGLNEAKIGIPAPFWFMDLLNSLIGARKAEYSLLTGRLYKTEEALKLGLIDEAAGNLPEAESKVAAYLNEINSSPAGCQAMMKQDFRSDIIKKFSSRRDEEIKMVIKFITNIHTQNKIQAYVESLKNKNY